MFCLFKTQNYKLGANCVLLPLSIKFTWAFFGKVPI